MTNAVRFSSNRPSAPETHVHRISRKFQVAIDFDLKCSITAKYAILFRWNPTGFFFSFRNICFHSAVPGAPAGFQARVGKIRRKAPKKFFRLPTLVFSLPTLPYVTVAHPAHRTEADLREKASLATNQEGPLPSLPLRLT